MRIEVNGKPVETAAATLGALLDELGYGEQKVATALNRQFVRAADRRQTALAPGDSIEVVMPRQGG